MIKIPMTKIHGRRFLFVFMEYIILDAL